MGIVALVPMADENRQRVTRESIGNGKFETPVNVLRGQAPQPTYLLSIAVIKKLTGIKVALCRGPAVPPKTDQEF